MKNTQTPLQNVLDPSRYGSAFNMSPNQIRTQNADKDQGRNRIKITNLLVFCREIKGLSTFLCTTGVRFDQFFNI
jgi:hypothetical protein